MLKLESEKVLEETVHRETIRFLTRKQEEFVQKSAEWSERYATDMANIDQQISDLEDQRKETLGKLHKLEARRQQELAEEEAKIEAERREKEMEEERRRLYEEQMLAARRIQNTYRKRIEEQRASGKGKKGKKGKGKGKKGKKK